MQRRHFIKAAGVLATIPALSCVNQTTAQTESSSGKKEIYEWRIYTLAENGTIVDIFFQNTLIPAYNKMGIKVGAFKLHKEGEEDKRYFLFIYPDITTYFNCKKNIWKDAAFTQAAQPYFDETAPNPAFSALETYLSEAFDKIPVYRKPDPSRGLFELRIYRSPNEEANQRKVKMFNVDEIAIFEVGINSVCYGDILAGPRMPALLYLTWYKDEETRSEAWSKFSAHPEWQRIRKLPEYAYTSTQNQSILLAPLAYSQL
jgi:hypothetical protein